jgi:hypothetical protein
VTEVERLKEENRRLRAEMLRAHEDLEQERGKVAYLTGEIAGAAEGLPRTQPRAAAPAAPPDRTTDSLERLFAAIAPKH